MQRDITTWCGLSIDGLTFVIVPVDACDCCVLIVCQEDIVDHRQFLPKCNVSNTVERTLWPWFLLHSASAASGGGGGDDNGDDNGDNNGDREDASSVKSLLWREGVFALTYLSKRCGSVDGGGRGWRREGQRLQLTSVFSGGP